MHAVRLHGPADLRHETVPSPPGPRSKQVVIAVDAVGVCGSDLHMFETGGIGGRQAEQPCCLGHEFAGTVQDVGPDAVAGDGTTLQVGHRVAVDPAMPCGRCENCREGHPNLCPDHQFFGVPPDDGALCERLLVPAENCFVLPPTISAPAGSLLETLGVALHSVDLGKLQVGRSVAVIGAGSVGLLIVRLAVLAGAAPVHVFDLEPNRRAKALELGATAAWDGADPEAATQLLAATGGRGVDVAFEVADAGASVDLTFAVTRSGGRVVLVGIPAHDRTEFGHSVPRRKGLTVRFVRRMKHTYPRAIALQSHPGMAGVLDGLVTHRFALAESAQAFDLAMRRADGVLKAVIEPNRPTPGA